MDTVQPPPQLPFTTTTTTYIPQPYTYNDESSTNVAVSQQHKSSSPSSSVIIVMIIISSAIIVTAFIYLLIRYLSRRFNRTSINNDVVSVNEHDHVRHHVISLSNSRNENDVSDSVTLSLPLFTFSSLTGKIAAGDCAVCLSKFEGVDQLRLLPLCCHAFHAQCIDAWLKSNQTCPLCRSNVNPSDEDIMNKIGSVAGAGVGNRSSSFRIEIGSVSRGRDSSESFRRSYSVGSYEYVIDDGYEISVESTHTSVDKDSNTAAEPPGRNLAAEVGSGRRNWLRDYVDRLSVSLSSRTQSFHGSGRFLAGSSRLTEAVDDFEASHGRIGEEISELFRWLSGV
ncbi:E3 ubiquitin-protein ligase ATL4-like [Rutidosis leptorrhynchoides]|uniref:E3 ubiquitin-protein ligase ATL4-like n=1 Tax=Rutidosis leptorrhynchoides TaxID=125765 RepID=UPI003A991A53